MSIVGSDYSAHRHSIEDLEKEYEAGRKATKRRETEHEARLEQNALKARARLEEKTSSTIDDIRDKYERSSAHSREIDRAQRDELKRDLYDRAGRKLQATASDLQEERDRAVQTMEMSHEKFQKLSDDVENHYSRRTEENQRSTEERIEDLQEEHREELRKARGGSADEEKTKTAEYREKLQREARSAIEQAHDLVGEERRKTRELTDTFGKETKYRERKNEQMVEQRLHAKDRLVSHELEDAARYERLSRANETSQLREKLNEITRFQKANQTEKNQGRAEAIREFESDWRGQLNNTTASHEREVTKLKDSSAESERRLNQLYNQALRDQGSKMAKVISGQNMEHSKQLNDAVFDYERAKKQIEGQANRTVELTQQAAGHHREKLIQQKDEALTRQARTYQETLSRQKTQEQAKIQNLERLLTQQNSTDDPGMISAAAEASVRRQVEEKNEKSLQAEVRRNRESVDRLQQGYERKLDDARTDHSFSAMKTQQQALMEQQNQKEQFLSHIQDVEHSKSQQLTQAHQQQEKTRDTLTQLSERGQAELRRHYEELIQSRDLDHDYKINTLRQTSEFEKKNMRREHSVQTSELIRGYEKKLTEQKTQYEDQLKELRARTDHQIRDNEKRIRQALDQQERAHNQRLADTESQHRERERLTHQRHEDELDKVKRANALLLSKTTLSAKS